MDYELIVEVKLRITNVRSRREALRKVEQWAGETQLWGGTGYGIKWDGKVIVKQAKRVEEN